MGEVTRIQSAKVEDPEVPQSNKPQVTDATCDKCKQLVFRLCASLWPWYTSMNPILFLNLFFIFVNLL